MSDLLVFSSGNTELLAESCRSVGITLQTYPARWTDYVDVKIRKALDFLRYRTEPFMMWVDGNDSLVLKPEAEILEMWEEITCNSPSLVMAAESNCWPDQDAEKFYPPADAPRFLNAGGYIGCRDHVISALEHIHTAATSGDDQREWTTAFLRGGIDLKIDHYRRIFASIGDGQAALDADSCVKHWNGRTPGREEYWNAIKHR